MFRFLVFTNFLILIGALEFCRQWGSNVGPILLDVIKHTPQKKCAPGFRASVQGEVAPRCYKYTPANSMSYETFTKHCKCLHGWPVPMKDNRVRFKRHFRGFRPQGFRPQYQARPLYGGFVQPQPQVLHAQQRANVQNPVLDVNTYECSRYFDDCITFPQQPEDSQCPPGFIYFSSNQDCYKFFPPQSWLEAERTCNSINSHLSSVRLMQELNFVADMRRQFFPNDVHRIQSNPLFVEEYDTWIGLNLTDRSKLAFRSSNTTWTEGFNWHTYMDWNTVAKLDNAGGNENCGFIKYRHDCTVDNFIQISIQDARCDIQMPFACRLKKPPPTPATTAAPPTTSTTLGTAAELVKIDATDVPVPTLSIIIDTTKKVRATCMV